MPAKKKDSKRNGNAKNYFGMDYYPAAKSKKQERRKKGLKDKKD